MAKWRARTIIAIEFYSVNFFADFFVFFLHFVCSGKKGAALAAQPALEKQPAYPGKYAYSFQLFSFIDTPAYFHNRRHIEYFRFVRRQFDLFARLIGDRFFYSLDYSRAVLIARFAFRHSQNKSR